MNKIQQACRVLKYNNMHCPSTFGEEKNNGMAIRAPSPKTLTFYAHASLVQIGPAITKLQDLLQKP